MITVSAMRLQGIWPTKKQVRSSTSSVQQKSAAFNIRDNGLNDIKSGNIDNGIAKLEKAKEMFKTEENNKEVSVTEQQIDFATKEKERQLQVLPGPYLDDPDRIRVQN